MISTLFWLFVVVAAVCLVFWGLNQLKPKLPFAAYVVAVVLVGLVALVVIARLLANLAGINTPGFV